MTKYMITEWRSILVFILIGITCATILTGLVLISKVQLHDNVRDVIAECMQSETPDDVIRCYEDNGLVLYLKVNHDNP